MLFSCADFMEQALQDAQRRDVVSTPIHRYSDTPTPRPLWLRLSRAISFCSIRFSLLPSVKIESALYGLQISRWLRVAAFPSFENLFEKRSGPACFVQRDFFWGACGDYFSAGVSSLRTDIQNVIRFCDNIEVML